MIRRRFLLLALLAGLHAACAHALTLTYSDQPLELRIHPHYRVDVQFPDAIVKVSGTTPKGGYAFLRNGSLLTIRPAKWSKDDPRYRIRTTVNVFLPSRAYQLDITPDWTASDQLITIEDPNYDQVRNDSREIAATDRMFLAFIRNDSSMSFSQDQALDTTQTLANGWILHLDRLHRSGDYDLLHGELKIPILFLPVLPSDLDALNIYPGRMGQVHIPDLETLHSTRETLSNACRDRDTLDPEHETLKKLCRDLDSADSKQEALKNVTRPVFFLYARKQQ